MNDTIPELEQFIEPSPVQFSPNAPGWYVLGGIFLLILLIIAFLIWNNYRKNRYRRIALNWLELEEEKFFNNKEYGRLVYAGGMITKKITIFLYGNNEIASIRGSKWLAYLTKTCPSISFSSTDEQLMSDIYESNNNLKEQQVFEFIDKIKYWIKKHKKLTAKSFSILNSQFSINERIIS